MKIFTFFIYLKCTVLFKIRKTIYFVKLSTWKVHVFPRISLVLGCLEQAALYSPVSSDVNFRFTVTIPVQWTTTTTFIVYDKNDRFVFQVRYRTSGAISIDPASDVKFTGDAATGNISFTLQNVQLARNGLYTFKSTTGDAIIHSVQLFISWVS